MAARFDVLLEQRLLRDEIRLAKKNMAAAATCAGLPLRTLQSCALDRETPLGPEAALANNLLHPLKPPRIFGMVLRKIK